MNHRNKDGSMNWNVFSSQLRDRMARNEHNLKAHMAKTFNRPAPFPLMTECKVIGLDGSVRIDGIQQMKDKNGW